MPTQTTSPVCLRPQDFVRHLTVETSELEVSSAGADFHELVAAVSGNIIRVLQMTVWAMDAADTEANLQSGGGSGSTILALGLGADRRWEASWSPVGWCDTVVGESLDFDHQAGTASRYAINLAYVLLPG